MTPSHRTKMFREEILTKDPQATPYPYPREPVGEMVTKDGVRAVMYPIAICLGSKVYYCEQKSDWQRDLDLYDGEGNPL